MNHPQSLLLRTSSLGRFNCRRYAWFVAAAVSLSVIGAAAAAQPPPRNQPAMVPVVIATVDGQPIYGGEVAALMAAIPRSNKLPQLQRVRVEAQLLDQLISRRLVVFYLRRHDQTLSKHQIDAAITDLSGKLTERNLTLAEHLAQQGITEAALRADIEWRMNWQRYTEHRLTDTVLEQFFDDHRADFDGRQVRVQHLLLKKPENGDDATIDKLVSRAADLRQQIIDGHISFDDAVRQFSQGASKAKAGDLGFIAREGAMAESFAAAAFRLKAGEISPPVRTTFGVHLIRCTDIKPGGNRWNDVTDRLRSAVIQRGFHKIVESERQRVTVEFTGRGSYINVETGQPVAAQIQSK